KTAKPKTRSRQPKAAAPTSKTEVIKARIEPKPRRLRLPAYRPFRFKRIRHPTKLPSVWWLARQTGRLLWGRRWFFLGIIIVYGLLNILLVHSFTGGADIDSLKKQFGGGAGQLLVGLSAFSSLFTTSGGSATAEAGLFQVILWIIG